MTTEKYIKTDRKWAKVTRDSVKKTFSIAIGYKGDVSANSLTEWPFKFVETWEDALEIANKKLND